MAHIKATEDEIPLFGWADDGWLTLCNTPTVNYSDIVNWFVAMRSAGFKIKQIAFDKKFGREFFMSMKAARFVVEDAPQYFWAKSEGFRRIEKSVKDRKYYYLHSSAYEYCVANVRAVEKQTIWSNTRRCSRRSALTCLMLPCLLAEVILLI